MKHLRFYVNAAKPRAQSYLAELQTLARSKGFEVVEDDSAEVIVSLGGDGTILRAVHEFQGLPILGLNLGGLGYLATVEEKDFEAAFCKLAAGEYRISRRSVIEVRKAGVETGAARALNDVVVTQAMSGHAARLDLAVDGRLATRYMADGLILATPTGSTAYSLAAGGPVLMPDTSCFVITPMSPHALGVRPMVVRDSSRLSVTSRRRDDGNAEQIAVYADGELVFSLEAGETAEIVRSPVTAAMVELDGFDPCETLARKLGWSGSNVR